ncbi:hypothetical protein ACFYY1_22770 [Streptomyces sp. NPDC001890]|uniref:hypothetical protein n=1 Tax=Streptomyces sp. NPDC001890 TaxID=3364620 RepID=UPI00367A471E
MQTKLHRWTVADSGRRFDDLFNFVHDPATLLAAFDRVAGNRGARTPGVDGLTAIDVEESIGVPGLLNDLRAALKNGSFRPLPVRERMDSVREAATVGTRSAACAAFRHHLDRAERGRNRLDIHLVDPGENSVRRTTRRTPSHGNPTPHNRTPR